MNIPTYPASLLPQSLMAHMQTICKGIGPRPSTSEKECQAADYVKTALRKLRITQEHEHKQSSLRVCCQRFEYPTLSILGALFFGVGHCRCIGATRLPA